MRPPGNNRMLNQQQSRRVHQYNSALILTGKFPLQPTLSISLTHVDQLLEKQR